MNNRSCIFQVLCGFLRLAIGCDSFVNFSYFIIALFLILCLCLSGSCKYSFVDTYNCTFVDFN